MRAVTDAPAAQEGEPPTEAAREGTPVGGQTDAMRAQLKAQVKREIDEHKEQPRTGERALVALPDLNHAGTITVTLTRAGYQVDTLDDWEEASRVLDRTYYDIVVTTHTVSAKTGYNAYQAIVRMPAEARRPICLILVADDVTTNDGAQAFKLQADMVIQIADLAAAGNSIREVVFDRKRVYQALNDARRRFEDE